LQSQVAADVVQEVLRGGAHHLLKEVAERAADASG
jgi:hypothetical protein